MRPVLLEIEGFNSFEEKQKIDFKTLTDFGLFGIFGKTGSGKTSILDAIIYALYGDMPRGTKNLVNINSKRATVRYIFTIQGSNAGKYEVSRSVAKEDTDELMMLGRASKNKKAVFKKYEDSTETVIADTITGVDKAVLELIGISYQDFTKTVVLPQGQFSQFLKEKNKDRKDMLERIFSLEKYGKELDEKVKSYKETYVSKKIEIDSVLATKKDVDSKSIKEAKKGVEELEKLLEKRKRAKEKLDLVKNKILEKEKIKSEISAAEKELEEVTKFEEQIKSERVHLEKLKKLTPLQETLKIYQISTQDDEKLKEENSLIKQKIEKNEREILDLKEEGEKLKEEISKIPEIKIQIEDISKAAEAKNQIGIFDKKKREISKILDDKLKLSEDLKSQKNTLSDRILKLGNDIKIMEEEIQSLSLNSIYKRDVFSSCEIKDNMDKIKIETEKLNKSLNEYQKDLDYTTSQKKEQEKELLDIDKNLNDEENKIYTEEVYRKINSESILYKQSLENFKDSLKNNKELKDEIEKTDNKIKDEEKNLEDIEKKMETLAKKRQDNINASVITNIRQRLKDGDKCPVCKNTYHIDEDEIQQIKIEDISDIEYENAQNVKSEIILKNANLKARLNTVSSEYEKTGKIIEGIISEISEKLNKKLYAKNIQEELENQIKKSEEYFESYGKKSIEIKQNTDKKNLLSSNIKVFEKEEENYKKNIQKIKTEIEEKTKEEKSLSENLLSLLKNLNLNIEDIKREKEKIFENEKKLEEKNEELKNMRLEENKDQKKLEDINIKIIDLGEEISESQKEKEKLSSNIEIEKAKIKDKNLLDLEIEKLLKMKSEREIHVEKTNSDFEKNNKETEKASKENEKLKEDLANSNANLKSNTDRILSSGEKIKDFMEKEGYSEIKEIFALNKNYPKMDKIQDCIKRYDEKVNSKNALIEDRKKMYQKEDRAFENMTKNLIYDKEKHERLTDSLNEKIEKLGSMKKSLQDDIESYEKVKELKKAQAENDRVLSEIDQIEKLLKGKKFVQFLSKYQLSYICQMASDILENISSGRYRVNIDREGEFIITDNLNGGINRLPETLSGGETFLVSLALSLSLSTQIQLKGNAPLEFFFLDEGFGTLDEQSLNQVLESIARLKMTSSMSIGIISHVKEIKEFVPIKLEVTHRNNSGSKISMIRS